MTLQIIASLALILLAFQVSKWFAIGYKESIEDGKFMKSLDGLNNLFDEAAEMGLWVVGMTVMIVAVQVVIKVAFGI